MAILIRTLIVVQFYVTLTHNVLVAWQRGRGSGHSLSGMKNRTRQYMSNEGLQDVSFSSVKLQTIS